MGQGVVFEYVFMVDFDIWERVNENGKIITRKVVDAGYPCIFVPPKSGLGVRSGYKTFDGGKDLNVIEFRNGYKYWEFLRNFGDKKKFMYGNLNRVQKHIRENYPLQIGFNPKIVHTGLKMMFIDIEVRVVKGYAKPNNPTEEICLIQLFCDEKLYILGYKEYGGKEKCYENCGSEVGVLRRFVELVNELDPAIICGFNSNAFDIPYITNRMRKIGLEAEELSPVGVVKNRSCKTFDRIEYTGYEWVGRIFLDYRDLYQKYTFSKLSKLSLETISKYELSEEFHKVDYSGEYDNLEDLFNRNYEKYIEYGKVDTLILVELEKKLKCIETAITIAYICGVNCSEVGGTLYHWQSLMYNYALKEDKVLPLMQHFNDENAVYVGGWVKATPGIHNNVYSYDFTSLYPSCIRAASIGIENYVKNLPDGCDEELKWLYEVINSWYNLGNLENINNENNNVDEFKYFKFLMENKSRIIPILKKHNLCFTPNGCLFKRESSLLERMMSNIFLSRIKIKKKLKEDELSDSERAYLDLQQGVVLKILMNSCYGSLALPYNNFSFGKKQGAAITTLGRLFNRWVAYKVNILLGDKSENTKYTVQADTDSNYFKVVDDSLVPLVEEVIKEAVREVEELCNVYKSGIVNMENEYHFDKFLSFGNKRYIGRIVGEKKWKMTGVALIDKSTPEWSKEKLKGAVELLFKGVTNLCDYVDEVKKEFVGVEVSKICSYKGVSSLDYFWKNEKLINSAGNTAPINSRGSIIHNEFVVNNGLGSDIELIKPGDKVYIIYMLPFDKIKFSNIITFKDINIFKHFNLCKYIDYDKMFKKMFYDKLKIMVDVLEGISLNRFEGVFDEWE